MSDKTKCALCDEPARIGSVCDACHDSMGTKPNTLSHPATQAGALQAVTDEQIDAVIRVVQYVFGGQVGSSDAARWAEMSNRARKMIRESLAATHPNAAPSAEVVAPDAERVILELLFSGVRPWSGDQWREHGVRIEDFERLDGKIKALAAPAAAIDAREQEAPDDLKLTLHMAPYHLNLVVGHDRMQLLAFGRDVWAAARRGDSPTVRTRNIAEANAASAVGAEGKEVQHGTATTSAAGTTAAPVNPEGRDSVTNAHALASREEAPAAAGAAQAVAWRDMATAPKDGTLLRLLVEFEHHDTEDAEGPHPTIGSNTWDNHHDFDEWQFAGWNWEQDCYTQGVGKPVGWLPMLDAAPASTPEAAETASAEASETVTDVAKQLYAKQPFYRGDKPVEWYKAPKAVRREWLDKAKGAQPGERGEE